METASSLAESVEELTAESSMGNFSKASPGKFSIASGKYQRRSVPQTLLACGLALVLTMVGNPLAAYNEVSRFLWCLALVSCVVGG